MTALGGGAPEKTWGRLSESQRSIRGGVLLVASESWNKSVLHLMRIPEQHAPAAGDKVDVYTMHIDKPAGRYGCGTPVPTSSTAGRAVRDGCCADVVEATERPARPRTLAPPTDRLLVYRTVCPSRRGQEFAFGIAKNVKVGTESVSLRRLRRTVQVLIRKEPAQNTQQTHDTVYVLGDPAGRDDAPETIVRGLTDAVDHARLVGAMRIVLGTDAEALVELSDNPELAEALRRGDLDTATAACTDFTHSPHSEPGLPCTASFLLCLACPNAVATRRHLPRLVYCTTGWPNCTPSWTAPYGTVSGSSTFSGSPRCWTPTPPRPNDPPPAPGSPIRTARRSTGCSAECSTHDHRPGLEPQHRRALARTRPRPLPRPGSAARHRACGGGVPVRRLAVGSVPTRHQRPPGPRFTKLAAVPATAAAVVPPRRMGAGQPTDTDALLESRTARRRKWLHPASMRNVVGQWCQLAQWLLGHDITRLCAVTVEDLADYAVDVTRSKISATTATSRLAAVSLLWAFAPHLPPGDRIPMPPWQTESMRDYLPRTATANENGTPPIHPAVMSPLLTWAMRFVDDFADDILAAWQEHQTLSRRIRAHANPAASATLRELVEQHVAENRPLPGRIHNGHPALATSYLAGRANASKEQVVYAVET